MTEFRQWFRQTLLAAIRVGGDIDVICKSVELLL
jgi:hypothetical protein